MSDFKDKYEPKPIKSVLKDIIAQKPLKRGVQQIRICNAWGETMGAHIESYTRVVQEKLGGKIDKKNNVWIIPKTREN